MARVLVTGGSGFIGSHVVEAACDAGLEPVVLDLAPAAADVECVHGDVRDAATVRRALRGVELVCHQAAKVGLGVDLGDLPDYAAHNDLGTAVLLAELARRPVRRVVLASSMVVYGEGRYVCAEHGPRQAPARTSADLRSGRFEPPCPICTEPLSPEPIGEDAPLDPRNVYAATKLHQEHLLDAFARESATPVVALRYHNVYGPRMPRHTPYAGVAALFADAIAAGRAPRVFEDGRQRRDFVHVTDVARANVLALTAPDAVTGAFNVCSGSPRTISELAAALHLAAAGDERTEPRVTGEFRLGDVRHVFADPARARSELGFAAEVPFSDGIAALTHELVGAR
jgi:dTDP-L-rhamnose 4-epimerase